MRKKLITAGAALLATAFIGQVASAKSLEDILKEKGVITEADYKEVTKVKPFDYTLGKGVTFTSQDAKYQLSIGSQMQFRYTLLAKDRLPAGTGVSSKFEANRIKLNLNGYAFTKDLAFKINYTFTSSALEETFLNYRLIDEAQIRVGQDKVQYSRQWITSSGANEFVDVSMVTTAFVPRYDIGVAINGKVANGLLYYSLAGYNGSGQNIVRSANDNAFAARVAVNPFGDMPYSEGDVDQTKKPLLSVGSSFYRNTVNETASNTFESNALGYANATTGWFGLARSVANTGTTAQKAAQNRSLPGYVVESVDFNTFEVDAAFKWLGLFAQAEYYWAQANGQRSKTVANAQGFYVQAGYFVIPSKLEIAGRFGYLDPNVAISNDHQVDSQGAVSWYFDKHNLKVQADYTNIHRQGRIASTGASATALPTDDQQVRVQMQLLF